MIGQIGMLIILLVISPLCVGLIFSNLVEEKRRNFGTTYIFGLILILAVFQVMMVAIIFDEAYAFKIMVPYFSIILAILSVAGIVWAAINYKMDKWQPSFMKKNVRTKSTEEKIEWILFFVLIGFQLYMAFFYASFDGDDAFYVVQSVATYETNTMYRVLPYTGQSTGVDLRHGLAGLPMWIAYVAKLSNIHPTILTHSILQFVFIPVIYYIYYEVGKVLFQKEKNKLPIFMIIVAVLQIFGNVSIYTNSTFFLTRTWQGKALLANLILPLIFLLLYWIFEDREMETKNKYVGTWILLFMVNIVAAHCSTVSVFLVPVLIAIQGLVISIIKKDLKILIKLALTCIPCVIYGILYMTV